MTSRFMQAAVVALDYTAKHNPGKTCSLNTEKSFKKSFYVLKNEKNYNISVEIKSKWETISWHFSLFRKNQNWHAQIEKEQSSEFRYPS